MKSNIPDCNPSWSSLPFSLLPEVIATTLNFVGFFFYIVLSYMIITKQYSAFGEVYKTIVLVTALLLTLLSTIMLVRFISVIQVAVVPSFTAP